MFLFPLGFLLFVEGFIEGVKVNFEGVCEQVGRHGLRGIVGLRTRGELFLEFTNCGLHLSSVVELSKGLELQLDMAELVPDLRVNLTVSEQDRRRLPLHY